MPAHLVIVDVVDDHGREKIESTRLVVGNGRDAAAPSWRVK